MSDFVEVNPGLLLPHAELEFRASRAGGPGGQHVNTSSTRIEVTWNVDSSAVLSEGQRALIRERLANRIDGAGFLRVVASDSRSQHQNRDAAVERLAELLRGALKVAAPRRKTRVPRSAKEARLSSKKRRSETKKMRGGIGRDE